MKKELFWIPFYGWFSWKFGMIPVQRKRKTSGLRNMLRHARQRLADGRQIVLFPEGTRRAPDAEPAYKAGALMLYEGLGVACTPVALNSGVFWPRRSGTRLPGKLVVSYLPAIPPGLSREEFKARLEAAIETETRILVAEAREELEMIDAGKGSPHGEAV